MNFLKNILFNSKTEKDLIYSSYFNELNKKENKDYWFMIKKQFKKNKIAIGSLRLLYLFVIIALLADFIANEKPIIAKYEKNIYFPVLKEYGVNMGLTNWQPELINISWKNLEYDWVIWPLIPYLPQNIDILNSSVSPFNEQYIKSSRWKHWLGTDHLGRDVSAGMIHGTRTALLVGIISMGIASLIGVFLGAIAGYYGDNKLRVNILPLILYGIGFIISLFYAFENRSYALSDALSNSFGIFLFQLLISFIIFSLIMFGFKLLGKQTNKLPFFKKKIILPVDILISRLIEIVVSIPRLFLIISIAAVIAKPSIYIVMMIIGLTSWTGIARFTRAELLRISNLEYIEAARSLGYKEIRIIIRHALPNALPPILISITFGIASAILIESALSFIGLGVPPETVTWGSMLSSARSDSSAWWLAIIPGVAIFITVTAYNLIGEGLTDAMNPKLKK